MYLVEITGVEQLIVAENETSAGGRSINGPSDAAQQAIILNLLNFSNR